MLHGIVMHFLGSTDESGIRGVRLTRENTKTVAYTVAKLQRFQILCLSCSLNLEAVFICASKEADVSIWSREPGMSCKDIRSYQCIKVADMRHRVWVKYWCCQIVRLITARGRRGIRPGIASQWQSWQLVEGTTRTSSHEHRQPTRSLKQRCRRRVSGRESGLGLALVTPSIPQTLAGEQTQRPRQERHQHYRLRCLISLTFGALLLL